ncbi:MAG: glycosyltransferase family 2 protein [Burkholderiales bacterium]
MIRFSVIVPIYNQGQFVTDAVQSVLGQSFQDWELIVVDDGSTDGGGDHARRFADKRVRVLRQENRGVMAARKCGLDASSGGAVIFLDGDDRLRPGALARFAHAFEKHPEAGVVYGDRVLIDESGRTFGSERGAMLNPRPSGDVLERLISRDFLSTLGQACISRRCLDDIHVWPLQVRRAADWVVLSHIAALCLFAYVGRGPVVEYRMAAESMARSLARPEETDVGISEIVPAIDAIFGTSAIVRRYTREQRTRLRRRAEASAFAWKGQELLRKREWRHARAYFLEALRMGSRDPRDMLCLVLTVLRAFPPGTRRWTGAFEERLESETSMKVPQTSKTRSG